MRRLAGSIFLAAGLIAAADAAPPGAGAPSQLVQVGAPNQAEGRAVIEQFRQSGPPHPYFLQFDLSRLPRRGVEEVHHGRLWGGRTEQGNVLRIEIGPGEPGERRFLLQNGPNASVWESDRQGGAFSAPRSIGAFAPFLPNLPVAPFDLEMPFLYWPDARLIGIDRVLGRPAHVFLFQPPAGTTLPPPAKAVRAYLDAQYHAPVQTELVAPDGQVLKTFTLLDLKKVGEDWLPKDVDVRDETTRDKGRFSVTAAASRFNFPVEVFYPDRLGETAPTPAPGLLTGF